MRRVRVPATRAVSASVHGASFISVISSRDGGVSLGSPALRATWRAGCRGTPGIAPSGLPSRSSTSLPRHRCAGNGSVRRARPRGNDVRARDRTPRRRRARTRVPGIRRPRSVSLPRGPRAGGARRAVMCAAPGRCARTATADQMRCACERPAASLRVVGVVGADDVEIAQINAAEAEAGHCARRHLEAPVGPAVWLIALHGAAHDTGDAFVTQCTRQFASTLQAVAHGQMAHCSGS